MAFLIAPFGQPWLAILSDTRRPGFEVLATDGFDDAPQRPEPADRLLTAAEAARLLNCSIDTVYRHARSWPFAVRVGRRSVRFSQNGIAAYATKRYNPKSKGGCVK
jgi:excisionase family DNA binding protein